MNDFQPEVIFPYRMLYWTGVSFLLVVVIIGVVVFSVESESSTQGNAIVEDVSLVFEASATSNPIFLTATALAPTAPVISLPVDAGGGGGANVVLTEYRYRQLQERIILKEADLALLVEDVRGSTAEISDLVEGVGGWVVSISITHKGESAFLRARVPAEALQSVLDRLRELATEISSENIYSSDVSAEYVDLQSQLGNLEAAEAQLQVIMEGAKDTQDVIAVFSQLTQVRREIESLKGQLQYYDEAAAYSSISLNLYPAHTEATPTAQATPWSPRHSLDAATDSALKSVQGGIDTLIWFLVYALLILLVVALPLLALIRWLK